MNNCAKHRKVKSRGLCPVCLANERTLLRDALKAWMLVESETNHPCPDLTLRAHYRKQAIDMTKAILPQEPAP